MAEDKALATTQSSGALARPSFIPVGDTTGTEAITRDDMQLPRLALAQSNSPQLKDTDPKYIEDLRVGHLFNSLTGHSYAKGPLEFLILRVDKPRWVEFIPREDGGGIKDYSVPANDPRTQFGPNGEKPVAMKFYDYILLLLPIDENAPMDNVIGLSLSSTQLKVAKKLNGLIKIKNAPLFSCKYRVTTCDEKNQSGEWKGYVITQTGFLSQEEEALYTMAKGMYEALRDVKTTIDMEHDSVETPGGDASFRTSEM